MNRLSNRYSYMLVGGSFERGLINILSCRVGSKLERGFFTGGNLRIYSIGYPTFLPSASMILQQ